MLPIPPNGEKTASEMGLWATIPDTMDLREMKRLTVGADVKAKNDYGLTAFNGCHAPTIGGGNRDAHETWSHRRRPRR